ncbi:hypothetical protein [Amycolatopsis sp. 195334CR]|uniref:hypothetical protein n=1 Tax=Amycolatopsis sp. 195334CR TaxID=2814588 RepID=UPI001A8F2C6A|nr:hypothetical protein [Amycolatopsis sp. 195334CR]MBN6036300.1 hypothetical protein [Amycolatopsis sp. 195334CR]
MASAVFYGRAVKSRKRREFDRVLRRRAEEPDFGSFVYWNTGEPLRPEELSGFGYRGQRFVAFRHTVTTRRMQGDDPVQDTVPYRVVQLAVPVGPQLAIVPKSQERDWARGGEPVATGVAEFDRMYTLFTEDAPFARAALPRESLHWLAGRKVSTPIVLAEGVLSSESAGELDANVLRHADLLVELAYRMPPLNVAGEGRSAPSRYLETTASAAPPDESAAAHPDTAPEEAAGTSPGGPPSGTAATQQGGPSEEAAAIRRSKAAEETAAIRRDKAPEETAAVRRGGAPEDVAAIRPGVVERGLLVLLVLGFLPLLATLVIIGAVAFVNSVAYFFGAEARVLAGGEPWLPFLESGWYGPFTDFGTAAQSFLLGVVLFGLPLLAVGIGAVRVSRRSR